MSEYDFVLDNLKFSYSSASTFGTCAYCFKLTYIDAKPRENNFYAQYGLLVHDCMEQFFSGKLGAFELSGYYRDKWDEFVTLPAPTPPYGLDERYRREGQEFFDNFYFELDEYEVIMVEDKMNFTLSDGSMFTARPDLLLKHKDSGMVYLYDFKTSAPFKIDKRSGKERTDKKKMDGYWKQLFIYAHSIRENMGIDINYLSILFPRLGGRVENEPWTQEAEDYAMNWLIESINTIKQEEKFPYDNSSKYFCNNLCSVREFCEYR